MTHLRNGMVTAAACLALCGPLLKADAWDKKTVVTISGQVEVPGAILEPGKYVLKLVDSPSDRHIVRIMNERENHVFTTTFAIPKERQQPADKTILTFYEMPAGQAPVLRAWFYPGDNIGQEFIYPKERAAQIALAMKPTQGGAVATLAENSKSNEAQSESSASAETLTAPAPAPENSDTDKEMTAETPTPSAEETPEEPQTPQPAVTPAPTPAPQDDSSSMPKTAGEMPLLGLIGLLSLAGGSVLRYVKSAR